MSQIRSARTRATAGANRIDRIKANGVHYTPPELAAFLAIALLRHAVIPPKGPVRVLDPACGDGSLLAALALQSPPALLARLELVGCDTDHLALAKASATLAHTGIADLRKADFLSLPTSVRPREQSLFDAAPGTAASTQSLYDLVIANPPYVRTQVLGAEKAQQLAIAYELSGRVDLYHAFIRAIASSLRLGGTLALLTSNRFLYTLAGAATRIAPDGLRVVRAVRPRRYKALRGGGSAGHSRGSPLCSGPHRQMPLRARLRIARSNSPARRGCCSVRSLRDPARPGWRCGCRRGNVRY